jgi:hypothetical protein
MSLNIKPEDLHPGKLLAIWYELPVTGKSQITGESLYFSFSQIIWEMEGYIENCIPIYVLEKGETKEIPIYTDSMQLVFPEKPENLTPLQKLAISALPLSHL